MMVTRQYWITREPSVFVQSPHEVTDCAAAFVELLRAMPRLERLNFNPNPNLDELLLQEFRDAFATAVPQVQLHNVKWLTLRNCYSFIRAACPNVTALTIYIGHLGVEYTHSWSVGGEVVTELAIAELQNARREGMIECESVVEALVWPEMFLFNQPL